MHCRAVAGWGLRVAIVFRLLGQTTHRRGGGPAVGARYAPRACVINVKMPTAAAAGAARERPCCRLSSRCAPDAMPRNAMRPPARAASSLVARTSASGGTGRTQVSPPTSGGFGSYGVNAARPAEVGGLAENSSKRRCPSATGRSRSRRRAADRSATGRSRSRRRAAAGSATGRSRSRRRAADRSAAGRMPSRS